MNIVTISVFSNEHGATELGAVIKDNDRKITIRRTMEIKSKNKDIDEYCQEFQKNVDHLIEAIKDEHDIRAQNKGNS